MEKEEEKIVPVYHNAYDLFTQMTEIEFNQKVFPFIKAYINTNMVKSCWYTKQNVVNYIFAYMLIESIHQYIFNIAKKGLT